MSRRFWIGAIVLLAALQVVAGFAGVALSWWTDVPLGTINPPWVFLVQMGVFSSAAGLLFAGARGDSRVLSLGVTLLLVAVAFARQPTLFLEAQLGDPRALALLRGLRVDAFLPLSVWLLVRNFPRALGSQRARSLAAAGVTAAMLGGGALLLANGAIAALGDSVSFLEALDANDRRSHYWTLVFGLMLPALPFAIWRARTARVQERRRVALFALGMVAAALPISLLVLAIVASEDFAGWIEDDGRIVFVSVFQALILTMPLTTAYSVLVDRVLPVRLIIRKALQYALARGAVTALAAIPFLWIAAQVYLLRTEPLATFFGGRLALELGIAAAIGVAAMRLRTQARDLIDRTFFREDFDARQILLAVIERSRAVGRAGELAQLLAGEIDRALHLERISVLIIDPLDGSFRPSVGSARPLPIDSALAVLLARTGDPIDAGFQDGSGLAGLPEADRQWVADCGAQLLVPLTSASRELIGLLALGEKRSELSFSGEDKQLLAAIGAAGAVTLESRLKVGSGPPARRGLEATAASGPEEGSWACERCGSLSATGPGSCGACGAALAPAPLPLLLFDKFQLERRVGQGGMGVVFRAQDLALGRAVAIKTLPTTTPEESIQLRREARAMAAVHHPNLALIYAAESWKGTPLLITEFFEGGTLDERIVQSALPMHEALELGDRLASALAQLHRAGILHGDVKPSNIAYTDEGVPKLLDFGLARSVGDGVEVWQNLAEVDSPATRPRETLASDQAIVGTPIYMSPEALTGGQADRSFDLWSLAVVLFEAISSHHPLEKDSWLETLRAIQRADAADLRDFLPECPTAVAEFFEAALHPDARRRPSSAQDFAARWAALRAKALVNDIDR